MTVSSTHVDSLSDGSVKHVLDPFHTSSAYSVLQCLVDDVQRASKCDYSSQKKRSSKMIPSPIAFGRCFNYAIRIEVVTLIDEAGSSLLIDSASSGTHIGTSTSRETAQMPRASTCWLGNVRGLL